MARRPCFSARAQRIGCMAARGIVVERDVKSAEARGQRERRQVIGGQRRDHRQARHGAAERQHCFDPFAGAKGIACRAKPDAVPEQLSHGPARRRQPRFARAAASKPGSVHAGDGAVEIGDCRQQCRPGFTGSTAIGAVEAPGMETQRREILEMSDCTLAEIGFGERAVDRPRHREQSTCRFGRSGRRRRLPWRIVPRQTQKASCLIGDIAKVEETAALADHVEEIAIFGRGGIGLMFNCT